MNEPVQTAIAVLVILAIIYIIVKRKKDKKKKRPVKNGLIPPYDKASPLHPNGFLWKPVSDGFNGRLVVLTSQHTTNKNSDVSISNMNGQLIERGKYHHAVNSEHPTGANGGRMHWLFNKTGGDYPMETIISINGKDYKIPNPANRYEG